MARAVTVFVMLVVAVFCRGTLLAQNATANGDTVRVLAAEASVRVNADPNSLVVAKVPVGTVLELKGREGAWYSVWLPGEQGLRRLGYIATSDVETLGSKAAAVPETKSEPASAPSPAAAKRSAAAGQGRTVKAGLDEVRLFVDQPSAQRVVIQLFSATDSDIKQGEKKDETKTMQADGPRMLADRFIAKLKELGGFNEVFLSADGAAVAADTLLVEGKFVELDPGSRAKRYFVGMGSGKSAVAVEGTVKASDGTVLATFRQRRIGVMGIGGGDSLGKLSGDTKSIGEDIAKFISEWEKGKLR